MIFISTVTLPSACVGSGLVYTCFGINQHQHHYHIIRSSAYHPFPEGAMSCISKVNYKLNMRWVYNAGILNATAVMNFPSAPTDAHQQRSFMQNNEEFLNIFATTINSMTLIA